VEVQAIPDKFSLGKPYPNPFNSATTFTLNLSDAGRVSLRVFNLLGQEVARILDKDLPAGVHHLIWEARDRNGTALASGLYLVKFEAPGRSDIQKIILLR
jgi:hypothetical protein